jgi:hypothetical protein
MGSGRNVVLFKPDDAEVDEVAYVRVKRAAFFSRKLEPIEAVYEEGPYDFALAAPS